MQHVGNSDKSNKKKNNKSEIVLYKSKDGKTAVDVKLVQNSLWLNLNQIMLQIGT